MCVYCSHIEKSSAEVKLKKYWLKKRGLTYHENDNEESFVFSVPSRRVTHIFPEHYRILSQRWHPPARATSHHVSMGPAAPFVSLSPSWGLVVAGQQWAQPHLRLRSTCCASWLFFHRTITIPAVSFGSSVPMPRFVSLSLFASENLHPWKQRTAGWPRVPWLSLRKIEKKIERKKDGGQPERAP